MREQLDRLEQTLVYVLKCAQELGNELRQVKSRVLTTSRYSLESHKTEEDTAEIDMNIFKGNINEDGPRNSPVLAAKVHHELARLYTFDAATISMIIRTQKRPIPAILTP